MRKTIITPLKRHRFLSGLRQWEIARAIGRPSSWLSMAEAGNVPVTEEDALRLSKILKVPVEELFGKGDCGGSK